MVDSSILHIYTRLEKFNIASEFKISAHAQPAPCSKINDAATACNWIAKGVTPIDSVHSFPIGGKEVKEIV